MLAKLRVTSAEVHTGSRLVRLACGTWIIVLAFPPIAGWASARATPDSAAAAPTTKARRCMISSAVSSGALVARSTDDTSETAVQVDGRHHVRRPTAGLG